MSDLSSPLNMGPELFLLDLGTDLHLQESEFQATLSFSLVAGRRGWPAGGASHSPPVGLASFLSLCLSRLCIQSYMTGSIISTAIQSSVTIFLCLKNVFILLVWIILIST